MTGRVYPLSGQISPWPTVCRQSGTQDRLAGQGRGQKQDDDCRTMVASSAIVFGVVADQLGRGQPLQGVHGFGAHVGAQGMRLTFLVMLVFLLVGGLLTLWARRSYPSDVSTALASEEATAVAA